MGLAPTGKRRLVTAHTRSGHWLPPNLIRPRLIPSGARLAPIDPVILEIAQRRLKDWRADAGSRGTLDEIADRVFAFSGPTILHTD